jgi:hypothetical protein
MAAAMKLFGGQDDESRGGGIASAGGDDPENGPAGCMRRGRSVKKGWNFKPPV